IDVLDDYPDGYRSPDAFVVFRRDHACNLYVERKKYACVLMKLGYDRPEEGYLTAATDISHPDAKVIKLAYGGVRDMVGGNALGWLFDPMVLLDGGLLLNLNNRLRFLTTPR